METTKKPIKRDPNLVPLSREHHFGLLFCWKIKQGLALGADLNLIQNYVRYFWDKNLQEHFKVEEELLLEILPDEDDQKTRILNEHQQIRKLVAEISDAKTVDPEKLKLLKALLTDHIRYEERTFFPYLEQKAKPEQLEKIGQMLHEDAQEPEDDFQPEFWVKKKS